MRERYALYLVFAGVLTLTGCSVLPPVYVGGSPSFFNGQVMGGLMPVSGAAIQLYSVGTTGDGSTATPLLSQTVTTDANGDFSVPALATPCAGGTLVYVTATGGDAVAGTANPNLTLMAALGPCSGLTSSTKIILNEATTVAAVAALQPYMTSVSAVGSGASNAATLATAFGTASAFVGATTGVSPGTNVPSGQSVPVTTINTLADILALCVNSAGGTAGDHTPCGQLFSLATPAGGTAPTTTVGALLDILTNPTANTTPLFALASASGPFLPELPSAPSSFDVALHPILGMLTAIPSSLSFGSINVGTVSTAQTVTLSNSGVSAIPMTLSIAGSVPGDFSLTNGCGSSVAGLSRCTVTLTATPSATGARSATLVVTSTASNSPQDVALSVTGVGVPQLTVSPSSLPFGSISIGSAATAQAVTLTNGGTAATTVSFSITGTGAGDFSLTNGCGSSVAAGTHCTVSVVATPSAMGLRSATLVVTSTASNSPQDVALSVTGVGVPQLTVSPSSLPFGSISIGSAATAQAVTLTNGGTAATTVSFSITGTGAGDFSLTNGCGSSVAVGTHCTVSVVATPSATGLRSATLVVTSNASGSPQNVGLSVTGTAVTSALPSDVLPGQLLFLYGNGLTQDITVTDSGSSALTLSNMSTTTPYFVATNNCGASVAVGASCTISVLNTAPVTNLNYNDSLSPFDDVLTFNTSDTVTPWVVQLSATNQQTWSPSNVLFVPTAIGSSASATIELLIWGLQPPATLPQTPVITGTNAGDFAVTTSCAPNTPASICDLTVTFMPGGGGVRTAHLVLDPSGSYIPLSGTGVGSVPTTLGLSPASVTLKNFSSQGITVTNASSSPVSITSVTPTSGFAVVNGCGSSVYANSTCVITVSTTKTVAGTVEGAVAITGPFGTETVPVTGQIDSIVDFGSWPVGQTSTVSRTFGGDFVGGQYGSFVTTLGGTNPSDFSAPGCGSHAFSCTFSGSFTPSAMGAREATMQMMDTTGIGPGGSYEYSYLFRGSGAAAGSAVFFDMPDGLRVYMNIGGSYQFGVYNSGTTTITFAGDPTFSGADASDFSYSATQVNRCTTLSPGGSCTVNLQVRPTGSGLRTANVTMSSGAGQTYSTTATVLVIPVPPVVSMSNTHYGAVGLGQTSPSQVLTITSDGQHPIMVTTTSPQTSTPQFTFDKTTCQAGPTTCVVNVAYAPTIAGSFGGYVTATDVYTQQGASVAVYGFGGTPANADVTPNSVMFTARPAGTTSIAQVVTVANMGDDALYVQVPSLSGPNASEFSETSNCSPTVLIAGGGSCTVSIIFAPKTAGSKSASLLITGSGGQGESGNLPVSVPLSGTGQ